MSISRVYLPHELAIDRTIYLTGSLAHRVKQVLRMRPGDSLILFNGQGGEFSGIIASIDKKQITVRLHDYYASDRLPKMERHLGQAIIKMDRMDWLIQKATELGITSITPLLTQYSQITLSATRWQQKITHWQQVAISACEQSGRNRIPFIYQPMLLSAWLAAYREQSGLVLHPYSKTSLDQLTLSTPPKYLLIGPEGGLTEAEYQLAQQHNFHGVHMGELLLRSETAALAVIATLQFGSQL